MEKGLNQVLKMPQAPEVGKVYFEKSTGRIIIPQSDGSLAEYGGNSFIVLSLASLPTGSAYVPMPELVPALQALMDGRKMPPVFVERRDTNVGQLSFMAPAHFEVVNYTNSSMQQFYYRLEFTFMNGSNPNTLQGEMRRYVYAGVGKFDGETVTLNRGTYHESLMPYLGGSASKVLTQRGTFVDLPVVPGTATPSSNGLMSGEDKKKLDGIDEGANKTTVDSALSATSTNPLQNKVVKEALDAQAPIIIPYASQASQHQPLSSTVRAALDAVLVAGETRPVYFFSQDDGVFYPAAFIKSAAGEYKFNILDCNGDGRLIIVTFDSSGSRKSRIFLQFTSSGDGTKVLADDGSYVSLPSQGLDGSRIFVANWRKTVTQPVSGIVLDILYPTDVAPVAGRDYAVIQNGGWFGPIMQPIINGDYVMPLEQSVRINGDSLDYEWSGTSLRIGIRSGNTGETTWGNYVNLKGAEYQSMVTTSVTMDPSDSSSVNSAFASIKDNNADYATIEISNTTGNTYTLSTSIFTSLLSTRGKKVTYLYFHNNTNCTITFSKSHVYHKFPKSGLSIPAKTAVEVSIVYTGGTYVFTASEELEV